MNFNEIVANTLTTDEFNIPVELRCCPDQYVGQIADIVDNQTIAIRLPARERPKGPALILVLESPHIDEFQGHIGPAKGPTGTNIARFLTKVQGLEDMGQRSLILVNAVQFQCSLGRPTNIFRDRIFRQAWLDGGAVDFASRMGTLFLEGDIVVVNACTKGRLTGPLELRRLVHTELKAVPRIGQVLKRCHPSKWNMPLRRNYVW